MAFATGLRRVLKAKSRGAVWGPRLFGFYGAVLVAAGVFTVDPMLGFPPGTPDGMPETLSWHAIVHNVTFIIAFLGLIVAQFVFVRRFASMKQWKFAVYSFVNGVATPMLIVASEAAEDVTGYILYGTGVLVNIWIISLSLKLLAESDGRHKV